MTTMAAGMARLGTESAFEVLARAGAMAAEGIEATLDKLGTAHRVAEAVADGSIVFGNLAAPGLVDVVAKGAELAMIAGGL